MNPSDAISVANMYAFIEEYGCTEESDKQAIYETAIRLLENLTDIGDDFAPVLLGLRYEDGKGVQSNPQRAFYYYSIAAERGNELGQCYLAESYLNGNGVAYNLEKAKYWFEKAADQGEQRAIDLLKRNFS